MPGHQLTWYGLRAALATVVAISAIRASPAMAQQALNEPAQAAFDAGTAAYGEGRYETALDHFEHADAMQHTSRITYNLAVVLEALGRVNEADRAYRSYLVDAGEDGEWAHQANAALQRIRDTCARVAVLGAAEFERVSIDGRRQALTAPATYWVTVGAHTLTAEGDGGRISVDLELAAGEYRQIDLRDRVPAEVAHRGGCASCQVGGSREPVLPTWISLAVIGGIAARRRTRSSWPRGRGSLALGDNAL